MQENRILFRIRLFIILFMIGLVISGITAFPIETELSFLVNHASSLPEAMQSWLNRVHSAVGSVNTDYPFLSYGTDWLAFAHIVIAIAFIGPLMDPLKNVWVIKFGIIACLLVFPLALIAGFVRGIPFWWRLIDCSFGIIGLIPLIWSYWLIRKLEVLYSTDRIT